jgi:hypothetical protein
MVNMTLGDDWCAYNACGYCIIYHIDVKEAGIGKVDAPCEINGHKCEAYEGLRWYAEKED